MHILFGKKYKNLKYFQTNFRIFNIHYTCLKVTRIYINYRYITYMYHYFHVSNYCHKLISIIFSRLYIHMYVKTGYTIIPYNFLS